LAKTPKENKHNPRKERQTRRNLLSITLLALIIKVFIILRIQGFDWYLAGNGDLGLGLGELLNNRLAPPNAWLGADGENYIRGLQGFVEDGFFSDEGKLVYWPAGYPLLMWPIIEVFRGYFFLALALLQSMIYAAGCAWIIDELRKTRLTQFSYLFALAFALNPTLSLNTIAVGYELPVVSLSLISMAALIRYFANGKQKVMSFELFVAAISFSLATLMQPRLILISVVFFLIWALARFRLVLVSPFLAFALGIVSLAPALLIIRNNEVHGYPAISTNLGVTMRLGAGPGASGGYTSDASGVVPCPSTPGNASEVDNALVRCVVAWYVNNPGISLKLFWNKARFFWSPWFGPEANGTMARNPWSLNHPFRSTAQTQEGFNLVFGGFGKFVSWLWMIVGVLLLIRGFLHLWKLGDLERLLALVCGSIFLVNLVSSLLTIGDHRFRIPSMGVSLLLQVIGTLSLFRKERPRSNRGQQLIQWPAVSRANLINGHS